MTDPVEVNEIRERAEKATPGPWSAENACVVMRGTVVVADCGTSRVLPAGDAWPNAEFIAHVREDIPTLLSEREQLIKERDPPEGTGGRNDQGRL